MLRIGFVDEILAVEELLHEVPGWPRARFRGSGGRKFHPDLAPHFFTGAQRREIQPAEPGDGPNQSVSSVVLVAFDGPSPFASLAMSHSTALRMPGQLRLSHAASLHIWCSRNAQQGPPGHLSRDVVVLGAEEDRAIRLLGEAEVHALAVPRSNCGKRRATAWAYCQTWSHVPSQQPTPSAPNRPLPKRSRWMARMEVLRNVRSSQNGRAEFYHVSATGASVRRGAQSCARYSAAARAEGKRVA